MSRTLDARHRWKAARPTGPDPRMQRGNARRDRAAAAERARLDRKATRALLPSLDLPEV